MNRNMRPDVIVRFFGGSDPVVKVVHFRNTRYEFASATMTRKGDVKVIYKRASK